RVVVNLAVTAAVVQVRLEIDVVGARHREGGGRGRVVPLDRSGWVLRVRRLLGERDGLHHYIRGGVDQLHGNARREAGVANSDGSSGSARLALERGARVSADRRRESEQREEESEVRLRETHIDHRADVSVLVLRATERGAVVVAGGSHAPVRAAAARGP